MAGVATLDYKVVFKKKTTAITGNQIVGVWSPNTCGESCQPLALRLGFMREINLHIIAVG